LPLIDNPSRVEFLGKHSLLPDIPVTEEVDQLKSSSITYDGLLAANNIYVNAFLSQKAVSYFDGLDDFGKLPRSVFHRVSIAVDDWTREEPSCRFCDDRGQAPNRPPIGGRPKRINCKKAGVAYGGRVAARHGIPVASETDAKLTMIRASRH